MDLQGVRGGDGELSARPDRTGGLWTGPAAECADVPKTHGSRELFFCTRGGSQHPG